MVRDARGADKEEEDVVTVVVEVEVDCCRCCSRRFARFDDEPVLSVRWYFVVIRVLRGGVRQLGGEFGARKLRLGEEKLERVLHYGRNKIGIEHLRRGRKRGYASN
jgi:hypothetical protein